MMVDSRSAVIYGSVGMLIVVVLSFVGGSIVEMKRRREGAPPDYRPLAALRVLVLIALVMMVITLGFATISR